MHTCVFISCKCVLDVRTNVIHVNQYNYKYDYFLRALGWVSPRFSAEHLQNLNLFMMLERIVVFKEMLGCFFKPQSKLLYYLSADISKKTCFCGMYMHSAPLGWRDFVRHKNFNSLMVMRGKRQKQIELSLWIQWFAIPISDRISIPTWIWARCPPYPSSFGNLHAVLAPQLRYTEVMSSVKNEKTWNNLPVTQSSFFITFFQIVSNGCVF